MQGVALIADDDRVAGVRAAVVANNHIVSASEQVNDLALALVAPLQTDDRGVGGAPGSIVIRTGGPVVYHGRSLACWVMLPVGQRWPRQG